jgi:subtilisin family serine protease
MLIVFLVGVLFCSFLTLAQVPPPDTGKMSWDLFQTVAAGQRKRAVGDDVQTVSVLLITSSPVTQGYISALAELGYTVLGAFGQFVLVEAPSDYYSDPENGVDNIDFVSNATLPPATITSASEPTPITNGTPAIGVDPMWTHGCRGAGTKIAVIDAGGDPNNATLAQLNSTFYAVYPTGVGVRTYDVVEGAVAQVSEHGTSCAIIAGDVAPEADLYIMSYPLDTGPIGWLCALDYAVHTLGVDVVSTSVSFGMPTCHADGTGYLNEEVDRILNGTATTLVIAAGNWAQGDGADRTFYAGTFTDSDGDYNHDFTSDTDDVWDRNTLQFYAREGNRVSIILEWDDWAADLGTQDLDIILYDAMYRVPLAYSQAQQFENGTNPEEHFYFYLPYTGNYCIEIINRAAKWEGQEVQPLSFHLNLLNSGRHFDTVEHHTTCGSVREVATNPGVITVGAVSVEDGAVREYSSRGPTASGLSKPDLYAPDGVTGTLILPFYGTSASAPYVAGAVALVRSLLPELSKQEILHRLQNRESETTSVGQDGSQSGGIVSQKPDSECTDNCGNPLYRLDLATIIQE